MKTFFLSLALMYTINIFAQFSLKSLTGTENTILLYFKTPSLASGWYSTALGKFNTATGIRLC